MSRHRFDRSYRVLLVAPKTKAQPNPKDRSFMREGYASTLALFHGMSVASGERLFFQRYNPELGWMTVKSRGVQAA